MSKPALVNVGSVVNPANEALKALNQVVNTHTASKKEAREASMYEEELDERDRIRHNRELLKTYDPQIGVKGKGLSGDALKLYNEKSEALVNHYSSLADKGEEVPSPEELYAELNTIGRSLATKESAKRSIVKDLIGKGIGRENALLAADMYTGDLTSQKDLKAQEDARVTALNAREKEYREAATAMENINRQTFKINNPASGNDSDKYSKSTKSGYSNGKSYGGWTSDKASKNLEYFKETFGDWGWDGERAADTLTDVLYTINVERLQEGLPEIPFDLAVHAVVANRDDGFFGLDKKSKFAGKPADLAAELRLAVRKTADAYKKESSSKTSGNGNRPVYRPSAEAIRAIGTIHRERARPLNEIEKERVNNAFARFDLFKTEKLPGGKSERRDVLGATAPKNGAPEPQSDGRSSGGKKDFTQAQKEADELRKRVGGMGGAENGDPTEATGEESAGPLVFGRGPLGPYDRGPTAPSIAPDLESRMTLKNLTTRLPAPGRKELIRDLVEDTNAKHLRYSKAIDAASRIGIDIPVGSAEAEALKEELLSAREDSQKQDEVVRSRRLVLDGPGIIESGVPSGWDYRTASWGHAIKDSLGRKKEWLQRQWLESRYNDGVDRLRDMSQGLQGVSTPEDRRYADTAIRSLAEKLSRQKERLDQE